MIARTTPDNLASHLPWLRMLYQAFLQEWPGIYPSHGARDVDTFVQLVAEAIVDPARHAANTFLMELALDDQRRGIGFFGAEIQSRPLGTPPVFCAAHWLFVLAPHRKAGHGRALVLGGLNWLAGHPEATSVELMAAGTDPQWQQRGWRPVLTTLVQDPTIIRAQLEGNGHTTMEAPDGSVAAT